MDLNLIYALLIAMSPVFLTIIFARRYNVVHGLISFVVFSYVLLFCLDAFAANIPAEITKHLYEGGAGSLVSLYYTMYGVVYFGLTKIGLESALTAEYGKYAVLAVYAVVFIISQVIASIIRKVRVNGIKSLRRQAKRY